MGSTVECSKTTFRHNKSDICMIALPCALPVSGGLKGRPNPDHPNCFARGGGGGAGAATSSSAHCMNRPKQ